MLYKVRQDYTLLLMDQQLKHTARYATHHTDVLGDLPCGLVYAGYVSSAMHLNITVHSLRGRSLSIPYSLQQISMINQVQPHTQADGKT